MALNQEFFDSINIEVVKKKYYNANKVNALLDEIRARAAAIEAENAQLHDQLRQLTDKKAEIGETLMSAQALAKQIVEQANERAAAIISAAEAKRDEMAEDGTREQEFAARSVEACFEELKAEHMKCIEILNNRWQQFLIGLEPEEFKTPAAPIAIPAKPAAIALDEEEDEQPEMLSPSELEERVAAIARELREIIG